ncbi:hypothetical protein PHLGIDRAFT_129438 [Phlebiopsis gigantea 11061_1 CR5-6]|uniref:Uncharacterized protein n=1 Tax=Phlebiopsis gigantea (strain 11061_1 CR5-6) TaxID=745531 RepID=A0A0C3S3N4_PHLG1|nr:hypothetical protein PHLGIDRAFT_129438 [Phlebiopsis gigantea 11061_1 CR5-6]
MESSGTPRSAKKTYSSKMKKKKGTGADATSDAVEDSEGQDTMNDKTNGKDQAKSSSSTNKRIPKKVEVELPGPLPLQTPISKKPASTARKGGYSRASSIVSASAASADGTDAPPSRVKPPSSRGAALPAPSHSGSQDEGSGDDSVSVAGSVRSTRKRKSEPDRIQFFNDDPLCAEVEPHRARCAKCEVWIPLHPKRRYTMQDWIAHRKSCAGTANAATPRASASGDNGPAPLSQIEAEGKAALENDARTGEIRPHEVFCTACNAWVALDPVARYATVNWEAHTPSCSANATTSPQVEAASGTDAHAPPPPSNDAPPPLAESQPVGRESDAPADDKPGPPQASSSRKRARDAEDDDEDGEGQSDQRVVRQRSNSYTPARGEALWNILTKPFRSFVEGFQQGLNMKPSPSNSAPTP